MTVKFTKSKAEGSALPPPSKSVLHRALICAALGGGAKILNVNYSDDILATLSCLEALGVEIKKGANEVYVGAFNPENIKEGAELNCLESGSTLRFFIPLCLLAGKEITLKGSKRLFERPLLVYEDICRENGFKFTKAEDSLTLCGRLNAGEYTVLGNISSQFITGLLFSLSLLKGKSKITILEPIESKSYIELTLFVMRAFGVDIKFSENTLYIGENSCYKAVDYTAEADCSNAAFLDAFNLLGGKVEVKGLNPDTLQGDYVYKTMFDKLKAGKREFDLTDCPDLAPVMFALSSLFGKVKFKGTARLRLKESDRSLAMKQELEKFGVKLQISDNEVTVFGGALSTPKETLRSHNDHRIAMALSVLLSKTGGLLSSAEAVKKSYPEFFSQLKKLKIGITLDDA